MIKRHLTAPPRRAPHLGKDPLWYKDAVIYELRVRSFFDGAHSVSRAAFPLRTDRKRRSSDFPDRFGSIQDSRGFGHVFLPWYNTEHRHSGLGMLTPHEGHYGLAEKRLEARAQVPAAAFAAHPERFVAGQPRPPALPTEVWINKPVALAAPNRDSEPEIVTDFASTAPHSPAADSTHTQVSPESTSPPKMAPRSGEFRRQDAVRSGGRRESRTGGP